MTLTSRYTGSASLESCEGWIVERLTQPSRLYGANGIRSGPGGLIYVAQVAGSQISAIDPDSGSIMTISPMGSDIVGPDDLVFDEEGNLYATEITEGRVSMLTPTGQYKVIHGDVPVANPITFHHGSLIAGELRMGGRIMELDRNGGAPRIICEGVPMANAFDVGPDGKLYFPAQAANEIWRVDLAGGPAEIVARDLGVPDSVKFDSEGFIISTQVGSGQVLRIDPRTGARSVLADRKPGLDNVTFVGRRMFVSALTGFVVEIEKDGSVRDLVPDGLAWPLGLAVGDDDRLFVCDGGFSYFMRPGEEREIAGNFFTEGYPGYARGVAAAGRGSFIIATGTGEISQFWPGELRSETMATGLNQPYGLARAESGMVVVAEAGTGRVLGISGGVTETLASNLDKPKGVAIASDGACYVSVSGTGRIVKIAGGRAETAIDGLGRPEGIVVDGEALLVVDALRRQVVSCDIPTGRTTVLASGLPIGVPPGVEPRFLGPIPGMAGPMGLFADITVAPDGTIYVSGDGEGSVLTLRRRPLAG